MKQLFKVIHVELNEPYNGKRHHYFGSKAAVYEELPEAIIGIKLESLWNVDLEAGEYSNRLCTIRMGTLKRKKTARGSSNMNTMDIPRMAPPVFSDEKKKGIG